MGKRKSLNCVLVVVVLLAVSCGPLGGDDIKAPANLELEPSVLSFSPNEDTESLLVKNTGGQSLSFEIQVSATTGTIEWLKVEPNSGVVSGGGATSLLVSVKNRDSLDPGTYDGEIVVIADGLEPKTTLVSLSVGQPILYVDPSDILDFGADDTELNLILKNIGAGKLQYTITPPGTWITTDAVLQKEITLNEPQTIKFIVDRDAVPWYGDKTAEMMITSNGLNDGNHSNTIPLQVRVFIDPSCEVDANCTKDGFYCDVPEGEEIGECNPKKDNGQTCERPGQCKSQVCEDEVCCDVVCEGQCLSCALPAFLGTCSAVEDGTECTDEMFCTDGDECAAGECVPGDAMDCSQDDSTCSTGLCDEDEGKCINTINEGSCSINGLCYSEDDQHPDVKCYQCLPDESQKDWNISPGSCLIGNKCYSKDDVLGEEGCAVCNPDKKQEEESKAEDETLCDDDGNTCTDDICIDGACTHPVDNGNDCSDGNDCTLGDVCANGECQGTPYSCDDGLTCTTDICDGESDCDYEIQEGFCVVKNKCYLVGTPDPDSFGCQLCQPSISKYSFTPVSDGTVCSDGNPCTLGDECVSGGCSGQLKPCDDGIACTLDSCNPASGDCEAATMTGFCLIDDKCKAAGDHPNVADSVCLVCAPMESQNTWTPTAENQDCDDLSVCSESSKCLQGVCTAVGPLCDDGLGCTEDICTEDNDCENPVKDGFCLIDNLCVVSGTAQEGTAGCMICDPVLDSTKWSPASPDTECEDGNGCTTTDTCDNGTCAGVQKDCGDQLICTEDSCSVETGKCQNVRMTDWCIIGDKCFHTGDGPQGKDSLCKVCDPVNSPETWLPANQGEECNDLSDCSEQSVCDAGECIPVGKLCDDGNECTVDTCTAEFTCQHSNADDTTACEGDGIGCTSDVCLDGACKHPVADEKCMIDGICYNDGDAPLDTICKACDSAFPAQWTAVNQGGDCNDNEWCTTTDVCVDGICLGGLRDCGGDQCNIAMCAEDQSKCLVQAEVDGTQCEDDDPCTIADQCLGGECKSVQKDCSELVGDNDCVQAFCDPDSEPIAGECKAIYADLGDPCEDGLFCTVNDTCDGDGSCDSGGDRDCDLFGKCHFGSCDENQDQCVDNTINDNVACDSDDNGCTMNDTCQAGVCTPGAQQTCSNVADTCNTGTCESLGADNYSCIKTAKGQGVQCDDEQYCTIGEKCDGNGNCAGGEDRDCSSLIAGQNCKVAFCNTLTKKCQVDTAPNNYVCDDGDDCTLEDICDNGNCVGTMDGCAQRTLNVFDYGTSHAGQLIPFIPRAINLGQGSTLVLWLNHAYDGLRARIVDRDLSMSWWEQDLTAGMNFNLGQCANALSHAGAAARDNGDFVVAYGYRYGQKGGHWRRTRYWFGFAAFDKTLSMVKGWTELYYAQLYYNDAGWPVTSCDNVPWGSAWGTFWPDDYIDALAFSDGSFAIINDVNKDQVPYYYPISSNFSASSKIPIGSAISLTQMTGAVLTNDNIVFAWANNDGGIVKALVANRNIDFLINPFYIAQYGGDPGHQFHPRVSALPNNRFIVAFQTGHDSGPGRFYFQVFNSDATKSGSLQQPHNMSSTFHGQAPCTFSDGSAVATWMSSGFDSDQYGIGGTIFNSNFSKTVTDLSINDVASGQQTWPLCTVDDDKDAWLAVWATDIGTSEKKHNYHFKRFTKDGENDPGAPERRANQNTSGHQEDGAAAGTDSGFFVAWESASIDSNSTGIAMRGMGPDGTPATMELLVNQHQSGAQKDPELAWNSGSDALATVWTSSGQISGEDVFGRLWDADGTDLTDEFQVNQTTSGDQGSAGVAAVSSGDFVFVWSGPEIYARRFNSSGEALGNEFMINSGTGGTQFAPQVLTTGTQSSQFIVVWNKSGSGIYARKFDKSGAAQGNEQVLAGGSILTYSIDRHSSGVMALCYQTSSETYCRKISSQLTPQGNEFPLASAPTSGKVAAVMRDSNRLWAVWERNAIDNVDGSGSIAYLDLDLDGNRLKIPMNANWHTSGNQAVPFTTRLSSDDVVVGWQSDNQDGSGNGVFYRVLD
jgi:hypothetical protein